MALTPGENLGRHEIRSKIGEGGMPVTRNWIATSLKILPSAVASDQQRLHRFVQEARAAAALFHANVAHIYEIGEAMGTVNYMSPEQALGRRGYNRSDIFSFGVADDS